MENSIHLQYNAYAEMLKVKWHTNLSNQQTKNEPNEEMAKAVCSTYKLTKN